MDRLLRPHVTDKTSCPHRGCNKCDCYRKQLEEYKDTEEQGLLLRLPCKVGDTVYVIPSQVNYDLNILSRYTENNRVYAQVVDSMRMWRNGKYCLSTCEGLRLVLSEYFGETWFLTREEAENALAGLAKTSAFAEKGAENERDTF